MEELIQQNIQNVLSDSFLEYAGYNIQRRAIPDVRDGLKWGARQLIYSQMLGGFTYDKPFKKAIKSVSQAMGFCYVHGDASAYGTFIRMAKPFSYRYPLQEANGNYGTLINPDDHSASRYVELRGSKIAAKVLEDIKKETITEWEDTYDLEGQFPKVLPSKGLWLGINGCISIGSGMSCSIPPTNLKEVNKILIKLIDNPNLSDDECVCFPDFPTGATIINANDTKESMKNGYGWACKIRATVEWDQQDRCFIVTEMPYSTFTNTICSELANLIDENPDCGITDFKDYTGEKPDLRIYLNKKANPDKVLRLLYKQTSLETFFTINMVMLDMGRFPKVFTWKEMLQAHINHEREVYRRGFEFDLRKIEKRIHIIDALLTCLANIDEVVKIIKESSSTSVASTSLQSKFLLDAEQAEAVLDMKLSRLAHLEVKKLEDEKIKLQQESDRLIKILNDDELFKNEIKRGWKEVADKFGDDRRTKIISLSTNDNEEVVEKKTLQVSLSNKNNLFINETSTLYSQKRGGAGSKIKTDVDEFIITSKNVETTDELLFFSKKGNYYRCKASSLIENDKISLFNLINLNTDDTICEFSPLNKEKNSAYILFITKQGMIKKSDLEDYNTNRSGIRALSLNDGDEIANVIFTNDSKIGLLTEQGNFIIITTNDINVTGRITKGIHAIKLNDNDCVQSAKIIPNNYTDMISISGNGYIKQTGRQDFVIQSKNTKGTKIQKISEDDWLADFYPVVNEKEITIASTRSKITISLEDVPRLSKNTIGVKSIKLNAKDNVMKILSY